MANRWLSLALRLPSTDAVVPKNANANGLLSPAMTIKLALSKGVATAFMKSPLTSPQDVSQLVRPRWHGLL